MTDTTWNNDYLDCLSEQQQPLTFPHFSQNNDVYLHVHHFDFSIQDLLPDSDPDPFDPTRFLTHPKSPDPFDPPRFLTHPESPDPFDPTRFLTHPETSDPFDPTRFLTHPETSDPFDPTRHLTHPEPPDPFDPTRFLTHPEASHYGVLDVSSFLNVESPENDQIFVGCGGSGESNGSNRGLTGTEESQGEGKSVTSSPCFDKKSIKNGVVEQGISLGGNDSVDEKNGVLKQKKNSEDCSNSDRCSNKRKSGESSCNDGGDHEEEEKRKVRLERNRESAMLSRQRKKHYVEELEDKVRTMHCTIQDLSAKISYVIAENASLKQQMGGGVVSSSGGQPPGMYPPPGVMYPWMHAPPYMMKAQGSQVPLVPIPRLKSRQVGSAPNKSRKAENKKSGGRTKKVASVSFLGLLFFMVLFGVLVPMVSVRYGGKKHPFMGKSVLVGDGRYEKQHGRVLSVNGSGYGEKLSKAPDINSKFNGEYRSVGVGNGSEPLMASLYVPRNDKLVKIDGNLIIHSILASEKATAPHEDQQEKKNDVTDLAVLGDLVPSDPKRNAGRHRHLALGSEVKSENLKATSADHQLQEWFREGLAGPMLSSGRCTEVFQFDVVSASAPRSVVSATSSRNVSTTNNKNSTHVSKRRNRRILHRLPIPLPGFSAHNVSDERSGRKAANGSFPGTNSSSSMVVSVLMDPREEGDAEGDGVMGSKSLSKIFVVVLIDGVKYVTYSCMYPFKGATVPHLVTA